MSFKLTKNFRLEEFICPHCSRVRVSEKFDSLVKTLQSLRDIWSLPIEITSGYRCECQNYHLTRMGYQVSLNSRHLAGIAADFRPAGDKSRDSLLALYNLANQMGGFGFLKVYKYHIHGDMR